MLKMLNLLSNKCQQIHGHQWQLERAIDFAKKTGKEDVINIIRIWTATALEGRCTSISSKMKKEIAKYSNNENLNPDF